MLKLLVDKETGDGLQQNTPLSYGLLEQGF